MDNQIKKVHYAELDDMERYDKNFDRSKYENMSEEEAHKIFREFYANNLPVDLLTWCRVNEPSDEMLWKKGYWEQIMFIRDTVNPMFYPTYEEWQENPVMVINTHTSKSIKLPVYELRLKKYGITVIIRNNFYDWKVSVISEKDLNVDFMGLFNEEEVISHVYCEGFKREQVFGSFKDNKKQFTVEIGGVYNIYTFMFLLRNYLKK